MRSSWRRFRMSEGAAYNDTGPMPVDRNETPSVRLPWLTMSSTILVAAALLDVYQPGLQKWVAACSTSKAQVRPALEAAPVGDSLRITWPARKAAALFVKDGGEWHRIELDRDARADGRFLYRPSSTEVLVHLDETDGATEMVHVLGLQPAPPVEVAQATPAPRPQEQTADRALPVSPEAAGRTVPVPLPLALRTIRGAIRVDVLVTVATGGAVQSAELLNPSPSSYFNRLSLAAAQTSRFPPSASGDSLVLHYEYAREGVHVSQLAR
jgi:hypothetical protein